MINFDNNDIKEMHYSGYTIVRAYGCNGELVYGEEPPAPTIKFYATFDDGGSNAVYNCNGNNLLTNDEVLTACINAGRSNENHMLTAEIGSCVTEIENNLLAWTAATQAVDTLTSVTIANTVTTIGFAMCQGRTALVNIDFPSGVTVIPSSCFEGCTSLPAFNIKDGVTEIRTEAFDNCTSFMNIVIPSTVTSIGQSAFHIYNGTDYINNHRTVTCLATTPPTLGSIAFSYGSGVATYPIYVPAQSVEAYKSAWSNVINTDRIQAIPN